MNTTETRRATARACRLLLAAAGLACGAPALADDAADTDAAEFSELLAVMSEETSVATKTKMNSDFVPGIVTVLDGEKLAALGARTVWDALPFIPGVQAILDPNGTASTTVRGVPFPFNNGNIQILLNGVGIGRDSAGINGSALDIPIAQVERIEFVRGPGSVVYGEFAFQGLLNIITQSKGSAVALEADSQETGAAHLRHAGKVGDWQLAANFSTRERGDGLIPVGGNVETTNNLAVLSAKNAGFSLQAQGIEREQRDLVPTGPNQVYDEDSWSIDASYEHALSAALDLRLRTQYLANEFTTSPNYFDGVQVKSGAEIVWRGWSRQTLLAGIDYADGAIDRAIYTAPAPPPPPPPALPPPAPAPLLIGYQSRDVLGIYLQDQVEITDRAQMTIGARWDDNSETGTRVTPRAALAWRIADHHVIKLQYAEGYRGPAFFELYTDPVKPVLDFEVNKTTEINYVYQQPDTTVRVTLYDAHLDDMVFRDPPPANRFANIGSASARGVEFEFSRQASETVRVDFNCSASDSEHNRNPAVAMRDITAAADWMTNLGVLWTPLHDTLFGLHWNHVGPRITAPAGYKDYDLLNLTFTRRNLLAQGLDLQAGVTNALDERIVYIHPAPAGDTAQRYDFRIAWLGLSWRLP